MIIIHLKRLQVVSTKVGGIPEILPDSLMVLSEPCVSDLIAKLETAIERHKRQSSWSSSSSEDSPSAAQAFATHELVKSMYNWRDVAKRTQVVYDRVVNDHAALTRLARDGHEETLVDKVMRFVVI